MSDDTSDVSHIRPGPPDVLTANLIDSLQQLSPRDITQLWAVVACLEGHFSVIIEITATDHGPTQLPP